MPLPKQRIDTELVDGLKRAKKMLGELDPVFQNQKGDILDGNHRNAAGWNSVTIIETKDELEDLQIMQGRNVHPSKSEEWHIQILRRMCEVVHKQTGMEKAKVGNYVVTKISTLQPSYARELIPNEYKRPYFKESTNLTVAGNIDKPITVEGTTIKPKDAIPDKPKHTPYECPHCHNVVYMIANRLVVELPES